MPSQRSVGILARFARGCSVLIGAALIAPELQNVLESFPIKKVRVPGRTSIMDIYRFIPQDPYLITIGHDRRDKPHKAAIF
jgi:hypothetical protein